MSSEPSPYDRVPSNTFLRSFGEMLDRALFRPIIITRNGRDRAVVVKAEDFHRLTQQAAEAQPAPTAAKSRKAPR